MHEGNVVMHEGNVVTVEGRLMHELKVSAFYLRPLLHVYHLSTLISYVMHCQMVDDLRQL